MFRGPRRHVHLNMRTFLLGLQENCNQLMMMKFGRVVNLEALQTLSINTNLEELKVKIMEKEQLQAQELKMWEVRSKT